MACTSSLHKSFNELVIALASFHPEITENLYAGYTSVGDNEKIAEVEENIELHSPPTFSEVGVDLRELLLELESSNSELRAATY